MTAAVIVNVVAVVVFAAAIWHRGELSARGCVAAAVGAFVFDVGAVVPGMWPLAPVGVAGLIGAAVLFGVGPQRPSDGFDLDALLATVPPAPPIEPDEIIDPPNVRLDELERVDQLADNLARVAADVVTLGGVVDELSRMTAAGFAARPVERPQP